MVVAGDRAVGIPEIMGGGRKEHGRRITRGAGAGRNMKNFETMRNSSKWEKHTEVGTTAEGAGTGNTRHRKRDVQAPNPRVTQPTLTSV